MSAFPIRIAFPCALLLPLALNSVAAQAFGVTTALSGARLTPNACSASASQAALSSDALVDWALARVAWSGRVASDLTGNSGQSSAFRAQVQTPEWKGWSLAAAGEREVGDAQCGGSALRLYATGLSYEREGSGVALRYMRRLTRQAGNLRADTMARRILGPTTRGVSLTAWHNVGPTFLALSLNSRAQWREERQQIVRVVSGIDTISTDSGPVVIPGSGVTYETQLQRGLLHDFGTELQVSWGHGRFALDAAGGRALGRRRLWDGRFWGRTEASFALTPSIALFGAAVDDGRDSHYAVPPRYFAMGLRLTTAPFGRPADDTKNGSRAVAAAFRLDTHQDGAVTLGIRAMRARLVELTGDFVQWKPVRMQRVSADWWELRVRMSPGVYRLNVRVDGGKWNAPPGVPRQRDEFGGDAGVIVVP